MPAPGRSAYTALTKKDLLGFDKTAIELILAAIEAGCTGRISSKGHCILHGGDGQTASVSRNMSVQNRTAQNARAQVRRLMATTQLPAQGRGVSTSVITPGTCTVSKALDEHPAAFARWMDEQPDGVPADARIRITRSSQGEPVFALAQSATDETRKEPAVATTTTEKNTETDPAQTLERIREVLGEDPRIAELTVEVENLREQLESLRKQLKNRYTEIQKLATDRDEELARADEAEARIEMLREVLA